jgi:DNA-binding beta-propeller fold protein YncE
VFDVSALDADTTLTTGMAVTADGSTLYVAAFGSSKVGVYSTSALENDTFVPGDGSHIALSGGGPSGLVLDEARATASYVTIRVQLGSGTMFCASAPAMQPAVSNDTSAKFNGAKQTPPPADCPHVPGNG